MRVWEPPWNLWVGLLESSSWQNLFSLVMGKSLVTNYPARDFDEASWQNLFHADVHCLPAICQWGLVLLAVYRAYPLSWRTILCARIWLVLLNCIQPKDSIIPSQSILSVGLYCLLHVRFQMRCKDIAVVGCVRQSGWMKFWERMRTGHLVVSIVEMQSLCKYLANHNTVTWMERPTLTVGIQTGHYIPFKGMDKFSSSCCFNTYTLHSVCGLHSLIIYIHTHTYESYVCLNEVLWPLERVFLFVFHRGACLHRRVAGCTVTNL